MVELALGSGLKIVAQSVGEPHLIDSEIQFAASEPHLIDSEIQFAASEPHLIDLDVYFAAQSILELQLGRYDR